MQYVDNHSCLRHGQRVALICKHIGVELGFDEKQLQDIELCALLHDIGKTQIDQDILNKKGKLTDKEYAEIKKHPEYSCKIVKNCGFFDGLAGCVLHHHEDFDGSGYPDGLQGEDIPLYSRIIRVADVFDALCSDRPYRDKYTVEQAIMIMDNQFKSKFDPFIYQVFLQTLKNTVLNFSTGNGGK